MFSYSGYHSYGFFFDLLAFSLILLPCWYALSAARARRILMIFASIYMLYFIAPRLAVFYVLFWCLLFGLHRAIAALEKRGGSGPLFPAALLAALSPMLAWKLMGNDFNFDFNLVLNGMLQPVSQKLWEIDMSRSLLTPIGISFAAFRAVDFLIKTYLGKLGPLSFDRVLFFGLFPPVQVTGPISEYEETEGETQTFDPQNLYEGLFRIASGFIKVFALSTLLEGTAEAISKPDGLTAGAAWLALVGYSWYFYLNFSGYSDIAIGIARLYGFRLKENFSFPFFSRNIAEFWNSWHMSLTRFAQRNIFVPAGGYRAKTQYPALVLTMTVISLWHGLNTALLAHAAWHSMGLIAHRLYAGKRKGAPAPGRAWQAACILGTYIFAIFSFPLVTAPSLHDALPFYKALLGAG